MNKITKMKYLFLLFALILSAALNAQSIKKGDNVKEEFNKIMQPYYFHAPSFTGFAEGSNMILIGSKPNPKDCDFLFIGLEDTTLIGVFKVSEPNSFFFDTEGNSTLNLSSDFFILPLWTVKNKAKISASDNKIIVLLDKLYEKTMQGNDDDLDEKTWNEYYSFQSNTTLANRHIALLFDTYQNIMTETAAKNKKVPSEICIPLMKSLSGECLKLYKSIPAIVCIYMGEALQSGEMIEEAREHFEMSLKFYPNSIPLLVYNYKLENDPIKKKAKLLELKNKYPKHWMVKNI